MALLVILIVIVAAIVAISSIALAAVRLGLWLGLWLRLRRRAALCRLVGPSRLRLADVIGRTDELTRLGLCPADSGTTGVGAAILNLARRRRCGVSRRLLNQGSRAGGRG